MEIAMIYNALFSTASTSSSASEAEEKSSTSNKTEAVALKNSALNKEEKTPLDAELFKKREGFEVPSELLQKWQHSREAFGKRPLSQEEIEQKLEKASDTRLEQLTALSWKFGSKLDSAQNQVEMHREQLEERYFSRHYRRQESESQKDFFTRFSAPKHYPISQQNSQPEFSPRLSTQKPNKQSERDPISYLSDFYPFDQYQLGIKKGPSFNFSFSNNLPVDFYTSEQSSSHASGLEELEAKQEKPEENRNNLLSKKTEALQAKEEKIAQLFKDRGNPQSLLNLSQEEREAREEEIKMRKEKGAIPYLESNESLKDYFDRASGCSDSYVPPRQKNESEQDYLSRIGHKPWEELLKEYRQKKREESSFNPHLTPQPHTIWSKEVAKNRAKEAKDKVSYLSIEQQAKEPTALQLETAQKNADLKIKYDEAQRQKAIRDVAMRQGTIVDLKGMNEAYLKIREEEKQQADLDSVKEQQTAKKNAELKMRYDEGQRQKAIQDVAMRLGTILDLKGMNEAYLKIQEEEKKQAALDLVREQERAQKNADLKMRYDEAQRHKAMRDVSMRQDTLEEEIIPNTSQINEPSLEIQQPNSSRRSLSLPLLATMSVIAGIAAGHRYGFPINWINGMQQDLSSATSGLIDKATPWFAQSNSDQSEPYFLENSKDKMG